MVGPAMEQVIAVLANCIPPKEPTHLRSFVRAQCDNIDGEERRFYNGVRKMDIRKELS